MNLQGVRERKINLIDQLRAWNYTKLIKVKILFLDYN